MKNKSALFGGVFLAVACLSVQAADLRVKGSIAPSSCSFTLTNSTIDYGKINPSSLSATQYNPLPNKSTPFVIKCAAQARVAISATDNRAASKVGGITLQYGSQYNDNYNYGLGNAGKGEHIGGYILYMRSSVADGKAVNVMQSFDNGGVWRGIAGAMAQTPVLTSWWSGDLTPLKFSTLSGTLNVRAILNKTSALSLSNEIKLDGHATLELKYI